MKSLVRATVIYPFLQQRLGPAVMAVMAVTVVLAVQEQVAPLLVAAMAVKAAMAVMVVLAVKGNLVQMVSLPVTLLSPRPRAQHPL